MIFSGGNVTLSRFCGWAALCATCLMAAPAWAQPYWENGDFLRPAPKKGTFQLIDTGERYGTWRVVGAAGSVSWTSGSYQHQGFSFVGQGTATNSWVNLANMSQSATGIAHFPVSTPVGSNFTLSFYVGNIYDPGGVYGTSSTVAVYENSRLLGTFTNSDGMGTTTENWKFFTITFAADAPWTTISFINGDPPGDLNCGIDNITFAPAEGDAHVRSK
jgi:hypothetical protein